MFEGLGAHYRLFDVQVVVEVVEKGSLDQILARLDIGYVGGSWVGQAKDLEKYKNCCGWGIFHEPADGENSIVLRAGAKGF